MMDVSERDGVPLLRTYRQIGGAETVVVGKAPTSKRSKSDCISSRWPVIDPDRATHLHTWNALLAIILIVVAFVSPFEMAFFEVELNGWFVFNRTVDGFFLINMALQFCLAVPDPASPYLLVKTPSRIAKKYVLSVWFVIDVVSLLPIDLCAMLIDRHGSGHGVSNLRLVRTLGHLRLLRVLRLVKLLGTKQLTHRIQTSMGVPFATLSLAGFVGMVILGCHWMACWWSALAMESCGCPNDHDNDCVSWLVAVQKSKLAPASAYGRPWQVYMLALYWAVITLTSVGYGDITPQTPSEYIAATVCTSLAASMWAYVIGSVCGIVSSMDPHENAHRQRMDDLNGVLVEYSVPHGLRKTLRRYFLERREISKQRTEAELMQEMSPQLRGRLALHLNQQWIEGVWFLAAMSTGACLFISERLSSSLFAPCEQIPAGRQLKIIRRGLCTVRRKLLGVGQHWGEDLLLSNDALRVTEPARAVTFLSVLQLSLDDLLDMLELFPNEVSKLRWAQVWIALKRGLLTILQFTRERNTKETGMVRHVVSTEMKAPRLDDGDEFDNFVRMALRSKQALLRKNSMASADLGLDDARESPRHGTKSRGSFVRSCSNES